MSKGPKNRNTQGRQKENKLPTDRHDVTLAFKREFEGTVIKFRVILQRCLESAEF